MASEWTPERIETLKTLWLAGNSGAQIAAEIGGVSRNAVIGKVARLGLLKAERKGGFRMPPRVRKPRPRKLRAAAKVPQWRTASVATVLASTLPVCIPCSLMELSSKTCRWPYGDPGTANFYFCGALPEDDKPYCTPHCVESYWQRSVQQKPQQSQQSQQSQQEAA